MKKIAVVGAGIFGCTTAIRLAQHGHSVSLFDPLGIMKAASSINQFRVHRGYHYPRSRETVEYVKLCAKLFEEEYPSAIVGRGVDRYYGISAEGSMTSVHEYEDFMAKNGLEFKKVQPPSYMNPSILSAVYEVNENSFDVASLYLAVVERLRKTGVKFINQSYSPQRFDDFDVTINATYANFNDILPDSEKIHYQFELCEKLVVRLPDRFVGKSVVVLDGEFCCVDPFGKFQVIGHVSRAIHDRQVGERFELNPDYEPVMNCGVVKRFKLSKYEDIMEGFRAYFPMTGDEIKNSMFGSMFTIRTVLPNRESDDARPSYITKHNERLYSIFSGKISTSTDIANRMLYAMQKHA